MLNVFGGINSVRDETISGVVGADIQVDMEDISRKAWRTVSSGQRWFGEGVGWRMRP